jgi:hypothetical protein
MIPVELINEHLADPAVTPQAALVDPAPSLLARLIEARLESEQLPPRPGLLPQGLRGDLRPRLPRIGMAAVMLFSQRKAVQSYPLLYATLALAHPN